MKKDQFLFELGELLYGLPENEVQERLSFYSEMIDEAVYEGLNEEEAVARLGPVDEVFARIMSEIPLTRLVGEKVRPKKKMSGGKIALLILGFPIWITLLALVFSFFIAFYAIVFSLTAAFFAAGIVLPFAALFSVVLSCWYFISSNIWNGVFGIGTAFIVSGLSILMFSLAFGILKGGLKLLGRLFFKIKCLFIGKEYA